MLCEENWVCDCDHVDIIIFTSFFESCIICFLSFSVSRLVAKVLIAFLFSEEFLVKFTIFATVCLLCNFNNRLFNHFCFISLLFWLRNSVSYLLSVFSDSNINILMDIVHDFFLFFEKDGFLLSRNHIHNFRDWLRQAKFNRRHLLMLLNDYLLVHYLHSIFFFTC